MGNLLFDLFACQSGRGIMNHGGKEYGEAVFFEIMRRNFPVSGIYDPEENINESFLSYCKAHGELINRRETSVEEAIKTNKFSAFYSALPYAYNNIKWGNAKFIGNLHGLRPLEAFTDKYEYKYTTNFQSLIKAKLKSLGFVEKIARKEFISRIKEIINNPSFVCITGSEHSKYALLNYFPDVKAENIAVFYDPLNMEFVEDAEGGYEKYYLLVSGNRWLKNTYRGVKALDQLISSGRLSSKVIVTGVDSHMLYLKEIKNKDHFIFKNYVSSAELASLYKNAYCLIFLSLSEGFGYPPLEAINRGTPVICSPLTALYEIYRDPLSIDDIKVKILEMEDPVIHTRYQEKGLQHSKEMVRIQAEELPKLVDFILSFCS